MRFADSISSTRVNTSGMIDGSSKSIDTPVGDMSLTVQTAVDVPKAMFPVFSTLRRPATAACLPGSLAVRAADGFDGCAGWVAGNGMAAASLRGVESAPIRPAKETYDVASNSRETLCRSTVPW